MPFSREMLAWADSSSPFFLLERLFGVADVLVEGFAPCSQACRGPG